MSVLMENYREGIFVGVMFAGERDVVDVLARLKITRHVRVRLEWFVRAVALENDHRRRNGRSKVGLRKDEGEDLAKLFQPIRYLSNVFFTGVADQKEILCADAHPVVLRQCRRLSGKNKQQEEEADYD